jgi:hypothetical protein
MSVIFPPQGMVYDYYVDPASRCQYLYFGTSKASKLVQILRLRYVLDCSAFASFAAATPAYTYSPASDMRDIVVPTGDGLRYQYLLARLCSIRCGALLVGPAGCGKSVMVHDSIRAIAVLNLLALLLN